MLLIYQIQDLPYQTHSYEESGIAKRNLFSKGVACLSYRRKGGCDLLESGLCIKN